MTAREGRPALVDLTLALAIPPISEDKPALLRLRLRVRLIRLDVILGGLIAVSIVWLANQRRAARAAAEVEATAVEDREL